MGWMHRLLSGGARPLLTVVLFALAVLAAPHTPEAFTCPDGSQSRPALLGEIPGLPAGTHICPSNDTNLLYGGCTYNPYEILRSKYSSGADIVPSPDGRGGIDRALACRLTKFFDAAVERGCSVRITSGYRSYEQQAQMCGFGRSGCAPPGASCHQYGLAVDVSSSCIGWLRRYASEFQLTFPYYGDHIQCLEHPQANRSSCNRECNGGIPIRPDLSRALLPNQVPSTYFVPPPGGNPSIREEPCPPGINCLTGQFLSQAPQQNPYTNPYATNPLAQPVTVQPVQPAATGTSAGLCEPQFYCAGNAVFYRSSACTTMQYEACPFGCSAGACLSATSSLSAVARERGGTVDIFSMLLGTSSTTTFPHSFFTFSVESVLIEPITPTSSPSAAPAATGSYSYPFPSGGQTFTSSDFGYHEDTTQTGFRAVLSTLKSVLLRLLDILRF